jgi:alpha-tubulin suppressor-like RCC1 family protein
MNYILVLDMPMPYMYCTGFYSIIETKNGFLLSGLGFLVPVPTSTTFIPAFSCGRKILTFSSGVNHQLILTKEGVFGIGLNTHGQIGQGSVKHSNGAKIDIPNINAIYCGAAFSIIKTDEGLFGTGRNRHGQLGLYDYDDRRQFTKINLSDVIDVSCGSRHSIAMTRGGVYAFGDNKYCQLIRTDTLETGFIGPVRINLNFNVLTIFCRMKCTFILSTTNQLYACGNGKYGQFGNGSVLKNKLFGLIISQVVSFCCGDYTTMVLTHDGLFGSGGATRPGFGSLVGYPEYRFIKIDISGDIISFACGGDHALILTTTGLYASGSNEYGQLGIGNTEIYISYSYEKVNDIILNGPCLLNKY